MNWSLFFLLLLVNPKHYDKVRQLYEDYHDHSVRLARSELCRHGWSNYYNDAEDVVQNAFKRILKYGKKINFEFEPQYLKGYVCRVTCNEVIRFLEQNKKHIQDLSDNIDAVCCEYSEEEFIQQLNIQEQQENIRGAISELKEIYRSVLTLKYKHGKTPKEIALMLGIKEKTVYTRIERAEATLLTILRSAGITHA